MVAEVGTAWPACRALQKYWQPPYRIGNGFGALGTRTVSMGATHHDGALQWDTHNLYGLSEGIATASAVAAITRQRPFVLSRCGRAPAVSTSTKTCPLRVDWPAGTVARS